MKIAWFSPLVPEHSEIANSTERLRPELEKHFEARLLAERPTGFEEPAADKIYPYTLGHSLHEILPSLNLGGLPVYNLGNNPAFFSKTWFLSQAKPGVVVLHDLKLHHFFEGIFRAQLHDQPRYLDIMESYYGRAGRRAGEAYWRQEIGIDHMAQDYPMTGWAIENALGVVVHTSHARDVLSRRTDKPVWLLHLPYEPRVPARAAGGGPRVFTPEKPARLIIFGYLNVNRRVVEFLEALAGMEEKSLFAVSIFGTMNPDVRAEAAIESLGLQGCVRLRGYVSEEELEESLAEADLAINLRYPTMGEASASQLRVWEHSLPGLVTRTEGYAVLPPDTLFFVRPEHEREDIQEHLRGLLRHPAHFRCTGLRGRKHLVESHTPALYVEGLKEHCRELEAVRSRHTRREMATRVGRVLPWSAAVAGGSAAARTRHYAGEIAGMF